MQSVYKFPISMACLHLVDLHKLELNARVRLTPRDYVPKDMGSPIRDQFPNGTTLTLRELLRYAIVESDGSASDKLLFLAGGKVAAESYVRSLGITGVKIRTTEKEMGEDGRAQYRSWAQPSQAAKLICLFWQGKGLSAASHELLANLMADPSIGPTRIKALLPAGTPIVQKTGTSGVRNGLAAATNDVALVTLPSGKHLAITVFVKDSRADTKTRDLVIAEIAKAAWDQYQ
jgi:beta-lactamase class A